MLSHLHIENIAVIRSVDIVFEPNFNVMSGETGAGKSIIIDAINALLGGRTSRDIIRSTSEWGEVCGVFTNVDNELLNDYKTEDGEIIITRRILSDGRNICKINEKPATVGFLRNLSLINIHGQQDNLSLMSEEKHIAFLDDFAGIDKTDYLQNFETYRNLRRELKKISTDENAKIYRKNLLIEQIGELEKLSPQPCEYSKLLANRKLLTNAGKTIETLGQAYFYLYGADNKQGGVELVNMAAACLDSDTETAKTLSKLAINLENIADEIRHEKAKIADAEYELEQTETRISALRRFAKRQNISEDKLFDYLEIWQRELDEIETSDERKTELIDLCRKQKEIVVKKAAELTDLRKTAAKEFCKRVVSELSDLDMQKVRFEVSIEQTKLSMTGCDAITFLLSANPGEPLRPLSKVASGGETARIMLGLKNILTDNVPTLIFDEVDTGVSGRAAQKVGEKLRSISRSVQVLCVTHLPQIAAMADTHFFISKDQTDDQTETKIQKLTHTERIEEISRLTAGEKITDTTRRNAEELLYRTGDNK